MKVAIIDGDVSYPATSGKRLRTLNLMLQVAKRHDIVYVGRCAPGSIEEREAPAFLKKHNIEPILIPHPVAKKSGWSFYARLAGNLFSSYPYSVASHYSEPMRLAIRTYAIHHKIDLWQFEWTAYLDMVDADLPGSRVVIGHNVDTLIWQRYYENEKNPFKKAFLHTQWKKFERFERKAFHRADRVVAVSEEDATLMREQFGQPNVDVVDNGIDRAFFESVQRNANPKQILFLGALDWRPNLDAVGLLLDSIFPMVAKQEPSARLHLVGRHPPSSLVERIQTMPNVELHADVPDVRPFLGGSGVMAVPLRIGGGSRLKILEALACGLPVVSTKVGAEGLLLTPGVHYVQAEENEMADALVQTLRAPEASQRLADAGRARVLETYDWEVLAHKLEASWARCAGNSMR